MMVKGQMLLGCACLLLLAPGVALAEGMLSELPVGERLEYGVYWGVVRGGSVTISCTQTNADGRDLVAIHVRAKSNWLTSRFHPVDDDVVCLLDPETRLPVRVEKRTDEDGYLCDDTLTFDRESNQASWVSRSAGITTNYPVGPDTLDAVSFLFALRSVPFEGEEERDFAIAVDGQVHQVGVKLGESCKEKLPGVGRVKATCFKATPRTEGLFVRKIPEEIWVSDEKPRIALRVYGRIPAGRFCMVLKEMIRPPQSAP
jgi:hypothetical protein